MEIGRWYALALASLIVLPVTLGVFSFLATLLRRISRHYFLRHLVYVRIPRHIKGFDKVIRLDLFLLSLIVLANTLALVIGVNDVASFTKRSGLISVINLTPLYLGGQMNLLASGCGISLGVYAKTHRWLGRVALIEGLVHVIATLPTRRPNLNVRADVAAIIVSDVRTIAKPSLPFAGSKHLLSYSNI